MKISILFAMFVCLFCITPAFLSAEELTALQVIQKADTVRGADNWGFSLDILDYEKEGDQNKILANNKYRVTASTFGTYPDSIYKSVAFFLQPKNISGQKSLKDGQIYWQYFPDTKNVIRISAAQRMAGQVNAADIASSNFANDYTGKLMGDDTILDKQCYKLELLQKNDQVAYYKLIYWIEKGTFRPIKVEYYAASLKLLKTAYFRDFKPAMGNIKPHELFIIDPLKEGHVTRMIYSKLREEKMPEYFYREANLSTVKAPEDKDEPKEELSGLQVIQKADEVRGADNWGFYLDIVDYEKEGNQNKVLTNNKYRVTATTFGTYPDSIYKSVAFFLAPKDISGQKSLKDGQVYWQYFPATKNITRISAAQRMAGQVNAADIASSNLANDYTGKVVGEDSVLEKKCYKLELLQKNDQVAYYKLIYWVEIETFNPVKVEYYATSGKLLKTAYYRDFKPAMGRNKPHELFIVDPLKEGHVTRMLYSKLREEKMPEYFFREANLTTVKAPEDTEVVPEPNELIKKADELRCGDDWKMNTTVYEFKPEGDKPKLVSTDKYMVRCKLFDTVSKSYVDFLEPATTRGQRLLRDGRVYWLYMPNTKNMTRISPSQILSGQATAGDIAATNYSNDYNGKIVDSETVFGKICYKLELTAKEEGVAYQKLLYWVEKETFYPIKTEYYSMSDKLLKTGYYRDFRKVKEDATKAHELFIVDPLVKDHVTRMIYENIDREVSPEYLYTKESLEKGIK